MGSDLGSTERTLDAALNQVADENVEEGHTKKLKINHIMARKVSGNRGLASIPKRKKSADKRSKSPPAIVSKKSPKTG